MRARKEQKDRFLTLLALLLIMKALRKAIARAEEDIIEWIIWISIVSPSTSFKQY